MGIKVTLRSEKPKASHCANCGHPDYEHRRTGLLTPGKECNDCPCAFFRAR